MSVRVINHLHVNQLEECLQSAYKENHSCETALTRAHNDVLKAIDNNRCVVHLLTAFGTVDHTILPQRLHCRFGFKGKVLDWFRSSLRSKRFLFKDRGTGFSPEGGGGGELGK